MKILVLTSRFPFPLEKGDKLRIYHQIKHLSKFHQIVLVAIDGRVPLKTEIDEIKVFCEEVYVFRIRKWERILRLIRTAFTRLPFQVGWFYKSSIKRKIRRILLDNDISHIYCQLIRVAEYVKTFPLPKTLDYMDTLSAGMRRRADDSVFPMKQILRTESNRLARYESAIWKYFDHHTIISIRDRDDLNINESHLAEVIPNGVNTLYFTPMPDEEPQYDLVFAGNLGYEPNIKAAIRLVDWLSDLKVFGKPIRILISGARPSARVKSLAKSNVFVSGWVKDIRKSYASGKIFVAPLFSGSGLQNKILEAMSMGVPVKLLECLPLPPATLFSHGGLPEPESR